MTPWEVAAKSLTTFFVTMIGVMTMHLRDAIMAFAQHSKACMKFFLSSLDYLLMGSLINLALNVRNSSIMSVPFLRVRLGLLLHSPEGSCQGRQACLHPQLEE